MGFCRMASICARGGITPTPTHDSFLLFPDSFERIFGGTDRYQIGSHFSHKSKAEINQMSPIMIDRELWLIRSELEEQYQTKDLDFYVPPLAALWKTPVFKVSTSQVVI